MERVESESWIAVATFCALLLLLLATRLRNRRALDSTPAREPTEHSGRFERILTRATLALIAGIGSFLSLGFLKLPHFPALATVTALASMVPIAGPLGAAAVCAVVASSASTLKVAAVLAYFIIFYELEDSILRPRIISVDAVVTTLAILSALLLGLVAAVLTDARVVVAVVSLAALGVAVLAAPRRPNRVMLDACASCELASKHGIDGSETLAIAKRELSPEIVPDTSSFELAARIALNGILIFAVLELLDVKYPLALACLVALATALGSFGSIAAVLVCAVIAGQDSLVRAVGVLTFFLIYSQLTRFTGRAIGSSRLPITSLEPSLLAVPVVLLMGIVIGAFAISAITTTISALALVATAAWLVSVSRRGDSNPVASRSFAASGLRARRRLVRY